MTRADELLKARRAFDQAPDHDTRIALLNQMVSLTEQTTPGELLEVIANYGGMSAWLGWIP